MSEHDLPALDDDVSALLGRSRGFDPAPAAARSRVLAAVEALALPPAPGGGSGHPGGTSAPASTGARLFRKAWPLVTSFALGGAAGAGALHATHAMPQVPPPQVVPGPERVVYVERPAREVTPAPSAAALVASTPPATSEAVPTPTASLAAERVLLDGARAALERQDGAAALAATRDHERRFPGGQLVQEREAMAVRALVLLGRVTEARGRTDRFRARFPGSVLLPVLEAQVAAAGDSRP